MIKDYYEIEDIADIRIQDISDGVFLVLFDTKHYKLDAEKIKRLESGISQLEGVRIKIDTSEAIRRGLILLVIPVTEHYLASKLATEYVVKFILSCKDNEVT